jgi:hypothetical protein
MTNDEFEAVWPDDDRRLRLRDLAELSGLP